MENWVKRRTIVIFATDDPFSPAENVIIVSVVTIRFLARWCATRVVFIPTLEYFILLLLLPFGNDKFWRGGKKIIRISRAKISRVYREFYEDPCIVRALYMGRNYMGEKG